MPDTSPKARDPWFDNAKIALVALVVLGHSWTLLANTRIDNWLYDFLYAWHVPAFVVITGYFSKSFTWSRRRLWSLVITVAVPYVVFEGGLALFRTYHGHEHLENIWANPHWPMWYLCALFFWRLSTPIFLRLPGKVVIAVAISLGAGLFAGDTLDVARILGLLPFFVLGLKLHPGHWDLLRTPRARTLGAVTLVTIFVLARFTNTWIGTEWLYYRSRYDLLDHNDLRAITIRMVLLLVGTAGALAFLSLVPRTRTWFTSLGAATLVVYLCHGFFVLEAGYAGVPGWADAHPLLAPFVVAPLAIGLALLLGAPPVARRLNVLVDPIGTITRAYAGRTAAVAEAPAQTRQKSMAANHS